jgi:pimeloyl-ACP methyl ester carboxylesterase
MIITVLTELKLSIVLEGFNYIWVRFWIQPGCYKSNDLTYNLMGAFMKPTSVNPDYSKNCAAGSVISATRIVLPNGIDLNIVTFRPAVEKGLPTVIFVSGMASIMDNFTGTLIGLTKDFVVNFVETREKTSSIIPEDSSFEVRDIATDISGVVDQLIAENEEYILVTYSLAATAAAESFDSILKKKPRLFVMIEPSGNFRVPKFGVFLASHFAWLYFFLKPFIKLYLKYFMVNVKEDYDMHLILMRILDTADPYKLAPTLVAASRYSVWQSLEKIDVPTIVIGASQDTFHNLDDAKNIAMHIKGATYSDMETNKRSHSPEVADVIMKYLLTD